MNIDEILTTLRAERGRIDEAIRALEGASRNGATRSAQTKAAGGRRGPRRMSAAARKRISEAAKKRWAAWRKQS